MPDEIKKTKEQMPCVAKKDERMTQPDRIGKFVRDLLPPFQPVICFVFSYSVVIIEITSSWVSLYTVVVYHLR